MHRVNNVHCCKATESKEFLHRYHPVLVLIVEKGGIYG